MSDAPCGGRHGQHYPDVVVMDIEMPMSMGARVPSQKQVPEIRVSCNSIEDLDKYFMCKRREGYYLNCICWNNYASIEKYIKGAYWPFCSIAFMRILSNPIQQQDSLAQSQRA